MIVIMQQALLRTFNECHERHLFAGESLFATGDTVAFMYLVRSGRIRLVRHMAGGATLILTVATTGAILAEASAYSPAYHCDAIATETASVAVLPRNVFRDAVHVDPALSRQWAALLASSLQAARTRAEIRTLPKVSERLDAWLGDGNVLPARGKLQDVAAEMGISREALYRELARRR